MAGVADPHKQAEALVREANLARVRGDFALAITRAQQAVELYGDDVFAHLLLGELFEQRRDWASALHHYEVALALKPDNVRAREKYALAEKRARSGAPAPKTARQAMAAMVTAPRPGREAAQPQDPDAAMRAADRSAAEFRSRLRLAFSRREKAEYLLARVAQERGHAGVPEDDLARLAAEYGAAREDGARRAMMLKREIANRLREVEALLQQVAHELSEIQEASARGEIDFTDADVRRSGARIRQQAATRTANALQELQRAQSAVDLGGVEMSVSLVGEIEADLPPDEPPPIVTEARPRWVLRGGAWLATGGAFLLALSVFMPWVTVRMPIPFGPTLMLPLSLHALAHPAQLVAATLGSAWDPASYDAAEFNAYTPWIVRWLWALVLLAGIGVMSAHMWRTVVWRLVHRLGALAVVGTLIYLGFRDMAAAGGLRPDAVNAGDFAATIAQIQPHVGFVLALVMAAASIGGAVWDFLVRAPLERDAPRMSALAVPRWALVAGLASGLWRASGPRRCAHRSRRPS
jgi:tetratricopeptide (TPR) repeat protein